MNKRFCDNWAPNPNDDEGRSGQAGGVLTPVATHHVWMVEAMVGQQLLYLQALGWSRDGDRIYSHPVCTPHWGCGAMFHREDAAERFCQSAVEAPAFDEANRQTYWKVVAHDIEIEFDQFTRPTPAAAADLTLKCLPNGVLFDAFGNTRVRYVRVIHDGTTCVVPPQEVESLVDAERPDDYRTEDVYLSKEEFDGLPEFDGF